MELKFSALPTDHVRALQNGGRDANGQPVETAISNGGSCPCRHCLQDIPAGEKMLILAYRPFPEPQPYAELGPIFLCANECERHPDSAELPALFESRDQILIRGYRSNGWINYGTGQVIGVDEIEETAARLLERDDVEFVHLRSSTNNCYQARIEKG